MHWLDEHLIYKCYPNPRELQCKGDHMILKKTIIDAIAHKVNIIITYIQSLYFEPYLNALVGNIKCI